MSQMQIHFQSVLASKQNIFSNLPDHNANCCQCKLLPTAQYAGFSEFHQTYLKDVYQTLRLIKALQLI